MIVFGAPHLFSSQSPINWALHTGNGNTLKNRRRPHYIYKLSRHWSTRSETISISSLLPDPPLFSLPITFKREGCRQIIPQKKMKISSLYDITKPLYCRKNNIKVSTLFILLEISSPLRAPRSVLAAPCKQVDIPGWNWGVSLFHRINNK